MFLASCRSGPRQPEAAVIICNHSEQYQLTIRFCDRSFSLWTITLSKEVLILDVSAPFTSSMCTFSLWMKKQGWNSSFVIFLQVLTPWLDKKKQINPILKSKAPCLKFVSSQSRLLSFNCEFVAPRDIRSRQRGTFQCNKNNTKMAI